MDDPEVKEQFIKIMFEEWTLDEMVHADRVVMHPSFLDPEDGHS